MLIKHSVITIRNPVSVRNVALLSFRLTVAHMARYH